MRSYRIMVFCLFTFAGITLGMGIESMVAQSSISYEQYTSENGLSENVVYCIQQDRKGFIWAGTDYGLNRFDGYGFRQYHQVNDDSTSLSNPSVLCMAEDDSGKLWIGTNGGLNYFDPETGKSERMYMPGRGLNYSVSAIHDLKNGFLVFTSGLSSVFTFDIQERSFHQLVLPEKISLVASEIIPFDENKVGFRLARHSDTTLLGMLESWDQPLHLMHIQDVIPGIKHSFLDYFFKDRHGNYFLSSSHARYLDVYDRKGKKIASAPGKILGQSLPLHVYGMTMIDSHQVWIGTSHGLLIYDGQSSSITQPELIGDSKSISGHKEIRTIFQDRHKNIWIGVFGEGLLRCDTRSGPFKHISLPEISLNQTARMIFGLYAWPNNVVGVETTYGHISLLKQGQHVGYIPADQITAPEVIYMTTGKTYSMLSPFQKRCLSSLEERYTPFQPYSFLLPDDTTVISCFEGLTIHTPASLKSYPISTNNVIADEIYFWVSSYDGLHRINRKTYADSVYRFETENPHSISDSRLYYVVEGPDGMLWIGTKGGGLNRFDRSRQEFVHYTTEDGLPDNIVYFILPDAQDYLWLTTNKGISRFNIKEETFCNFSRRDGLFNAEFNRLGGVKTEDGYIYFAGTNGIDYFKPEEVETIRQVGDVLITGWKVNEKDVSASGFQPLQHDQNTIGISFTTNDFIRPDLIYFRYRLTSDQPWTREQGRNFVTYSGLPPGRFQFEVQSSYDNLHWSRSAVQAFVIRPPWWMTWWFITLCTMAVFIIIYAAYQYRIQQLERMQLMRSKISRDLHDEIGSTLSSIHVYSSVAEKAIEQNPVVTLDALHQIRTNSRQVMENMSDIVWAINTGQNSELSFEKKVKNFGFDLLTPLGISTRYEIDQEAEKKLVHIEARKNVLLIAKEAMNNIARYSGATEVTVSLRLTGHQLQLSIEDNGSGLDNKAGFRGNGLHNMKQRTEAMGGTFLIRSEKNQGTSVICRLPLARISDKGYKEDR